MYQWPCVASVMKIQIVNWYNKGIINYPVFYVGSILEARPLFQGSEIFLTRQLRAVLKTTVFVLSNFRYKVTAWCHHTLDGRWHFCTTEMFPLKKIGFSCWILERVSWLVVENILPPLLFRSWLWFEESRWSYWLCGSNTGLSASCISRHCFKTALIIRNAT